MIETDENTVRRRARDRRRRLAARVWRLRDDVRRYRRLSGALGAALALAVVVLVGLVARADRPGRIDLGQGVAGVQEGSASYYSDSLEGRPTASGEPYRRGALTAAHRTLPLGSRLRVTNLSNGRTVTVRVNDRGPYAKRRVLDLSRAAASRLGMLRQGHVPVRIELLE